MAPPSSLRCGPPRSTWSRRRRPPARLGSWSDAAARRCVSPRRRSVGTAAARSPVAVTARARLSLPREVAIASPAPCLRESRSCRRRSFDATALSSAPVIALLPRLLSSAAGSLHCAAICGSALASRGGPPPALDPHCYAGARSAATCCSADAASVGARSLLSANSDGPPDAMVIALRQLAWGVCPGRRLGAAGLDAAGSPARCLRDPPTSAGCARPALAC